MLLTLLGMAMVLPAPQDLRLVGGQSLDRARTSYWYVNPDAGSGTGRFRRAPVFVDHFDGRALRFRDRYVVEVDCAKSRVRPLDVATYGASGQLLRQGALTGTPEGVAFTYQSRAGIGAAAEHICGRGQDWGFGTFGSARPDL